MQQRPLVLYGHVISYTPPAPVHQLQSLRSPSAQSASKASQGTLTILTVPSSKPQRRNFRQYFSVRMTSDEAEDIDEDSRRALRRGRKLYTFDLAEMPAGQEKALLKREVEKWHFLAQAMSRLPSPRSPRFLHKIQEQRPGQSFSSADNLVSKQSSNQGQPAIDTRVRKRDRAMGAVHKSANKDGQSAKETDDRTEELPAISPVPLETYASSDESEASDDDDSGFEVALKTDRVSPGSTVMMKKEKFGPRVTFFDRDHLLSWRGISNGLVKVHSGGVHHAAQMLLTPFLAAQPAASNSMLSPALSTRGRSPGSVSLRYDMPAAPAAEVGLVWWTGDLHGRYMCP